MAALAGPIDLSKGTVSWFDGRRGFGFITPEDGGENLFVHQSSIKAVGYRSLAVGEAVEFVVSVGDDGRRRAINVTGPGGAYIEGRRYFGCGEIGHMTHCKGNVARNRLGPCYKCGVMGHLARECPATRIEVSSPRSNILKPSKLCSIKPFSRSMSLKSDYGKEEIRTLSDRLSENMDSEDDGDDEKINNNDSEFPRGVEQRNWADLPRDVVSVIFNKITAVDIIRSAQFVCRSWKQLSQEPELWRHIVVILPDKHMHMSALESLAILAIDRSEGCVEEFHIECFASLNDELIYHMSDRATKLRRLRLISIYIMSEKALAHAIKNFPLLEEFELSFCGFSLDLLELVGITCPQLKSFRLNALPFKSQYDYDDFVWNFDAEAFSIAKHMQQLQRLQLVGNRLTNIGLLAILDNCPNLQRLDIRECLNVNFDENMKEKCNKLKELRLPKDSTADFKFNVFIDNAVAMDAEYYDSDYDCGYLDSDDGGFSDMSYESYDDFFERCLTAIALRNGVGQEEVLEF